MKTVICFDTEDEQGMQDAYKIMSHLCDKYIGEQLPKPQHMHIGKLKFLKIRKLSLLLKNLHMYTYILVGIYPKF